MPVLYETPLDDRHDDLPGSYAKTKWVAERLVTEAATRGIPVAIHRLGQVTGDTVHGTSQTADFVARFLQGCIALGATVESENTIDLVPVDFVARAIVALSRIEGVPAGQVFHLVTPVPAPWRSLVAMLRERGYRLEQQPFATWYASLVAVARAGKDNALVPYLAMIDEANHAMGAIPHFDCSVAIGRLASVGVVCPAIDREYVAKLLAFYVAKGVVPMPIEVVAAKAG